MRKFKKILDCIFLGSIFFGCVKIPKTQETQIGNLPALIKPEGSKEYMFDAGRIRKVFSGWEITEKNQNGEHTFRLLNKDNRVIVTISNYKNGDTPQKAAQRINGELTKIYYKPAKSREEAEYQKYYYKGVDKTSQKILGKSSDEFFGKDKWEERHVHTIFFENVKIKVQYPKDKKDYKIALEMIKEAIDIEMPIKSRKPVSKNKVYKINEMFDINKIEKELKNKTGYVEKTYNKGWESEDEKQFETYIFVLDDKNSEIVRGIHIESNEGYSKQVKLDRIKSYLCESDEYWGLANFKGNEKNNISVPYFNVPSLRMKNGFLRFKGLVAVTNTIVTEDYTIIVYNWILHGDKKATDVEYEEILKVLKSSLKKYK